MLPVTRIPVLNLILFWMSNTLHGGMITNPRHALMVFSLAVLLLVMLLSWTMCASFTNNTTYQILLKNKNLYPSNLKHLLRSPITEIGQYINFHLLSTKSNYQELKVKFSQNRKLKNPSLLNILQFY